jgi:hypothetical protein
MKCAPRVVVNGMITVRRRQLRRGASPGWVFDRSVPG